MKLEMIKIRWGLISILVVSNFLVWYYFWQFSQQSLKVIFLDVGQGDAILIRAPGGKNILIDGGPGKNILNRLAEELPLFTKTIDLLIETHPDTDHVGGLPDVLNRYSVLGIIKPCIESDNVYDQALSLKAKEKGVIEICAQAGGLIEVGNNIQMEILYAGQKNTKTNDASVVSLLTYNETKFLFTGDTTSLIERYLAYTKGSGLSADVYKVSHHGSKDSNDDKFLQLVKPLISVISVGTGNTYGHPHQEVLENLTKLKSVILRTDLLGTIVLESDGVNLRQLKKF